MARLFQGTEKGSFPEPQGNLTGGQMLSQGPSVRDEDHRVNAGTLQEHAGFQG